MKPYELTYIISSRLTADQATTRAASVESFIQSKEGVVVKSEKTAAQMLAYPVKKERSGYFIMTEFQAPQAAVREIKSHIDGSDDVLRSFIIVKKTTKEMKERRTRKPHASASFQAVSREEKKGEKADMQEIEKKLDELLS